VERRAHGRHRSGIIYTATVNEAERLHTLFKDRFSIGLYHGKMNPADSQGGPDAFMAGETTSIIATNAIRAGYRQARPALRDATTTSGVRRSVTTGGRPSRP
jgi:ATP-dependent DNA helicase RecQ